MYGFVREEFFIRHNILRLFDKHVPTGYIQNSLLQAAQIKSQGKQNAFITILPTRTQREAG